MVQSQPVHPLSMHYNMLVEQHAFDAAATLLADLAPPLFHAGQLHIWLDLFERLPTDIRSTRPDVLLAAGDVWRLRNNWPRAGTFYQQALDQAEVTVQPATHAHALSRHALICWLRGDVSGAMEFYLQAMTVLATTPAMPVVQYDVESGYAVVLGSVGRLAEAEALLQQQLRHAQRTAHIAHQWMTLHNLAIMVYLRRGAFRLAETTMREALHLAETSKHPFGVAYLTNNLAHVLLWQGHAVEALALGEQAQAHGEALNVPNVQAFAALNQAQAHYQLDDDAAAANACASGIGCLDSPFSSPLQCELLLLLSQVQHRQHLAQARYTAQDAYTAARMQGDRWTIGLVLVQLTTLYIDAVQFDRAQSTLMDAHTIFEQYGDQYHLLRCALLAALLAHGQHAWCMLSQQVRVLMADLHLYPALVAQIAPLLADLVAATLEHDPEQAAVLHPLVTRWGASFTALASTLLTHPSAAARCWVVDVLTALAAPWSQALLAPPRMPRVHQQITFHHRASHHGSGSCGTSMDTFQMVAVGGMVQLDAATNGREASGRMQEKGRFVPQPVTSASLHATGAIPGVNASTPCVLTPMEWQVLYVLRDGKTNQQIATQLCMSTRTVRFHLGNIYPKLNVANRGQAIAWIMAHQPQTT